MAKTVRKHSTKRRPAAAKTRKSRKSDGVSAAARQRFVNDLLVRGEAQLRDKQGKVPQDATHVITKQNADGTVQVQRVRFKAV
jgi:hypothetical protein